MRKGLSLPHIARIKRAIFLARGSSAQAAFSLRVVCQNSHRLARMSCLIHLLFSLSTPPTGLLFGRFAEQSPLTIKPPAV